MDITNGFYTLKMAILNYTNSDYTNLNNDFGIFKWPTTAILIYEKGSTETTGDNSNFDSGDIQVPFLKFSAFYIFFHFHIEKNLMLLGYNGFARPRDALFLYRITHIFCIKI